MNRENISLRNLIRNAWLLSILYSVKSDLLYFPFISMLRQFSDVLPLLQKKKIFTSIRGTDITVTPFLDTKVIEKYRKIYPQLESVHYLSPHIKQMANQYGLLHKNESVIHQGVNFNISNIYPNVVTDKCLKIISISRLHYIKGIEFGILAVRELIKSGIKVSYSIIGDGSHFDYLNYLVKRERMQNVISFLGSLSSDDTNRELLKANILLHPHLVEGLSNTMLEAIALGKKVVTFESNIKQYDIPALKHAIVEVPKYDFNAMANEVVKLYDKKDYNNSKEVREDLMRIFSIKRHVEEFSDFFANN